VSQPFEIELATIEKLKGKGMADLNHPALIARPNSEGVLELTTHGPKVMVSEGTQGEFRIEMQPNESGESESVVLKLDSLRYNADEDRILVEYAIEFIQATGERQSRQKIVSDMSMQPEKYYSMGSFDREDSKYIVLLSPTISE
jgi:hypothetical protein